MRKRCKVCKGLMENKSQHDKKTKKLLSKKYNRKTELLCDTCCNYAIFRAREEVLKSI